jgi:hypothetical protein
MLDSPQAGTVPMAHAPAASESTLPGSTLSATSSRALVPLFAVTLFVSSFLMFTVEPMVARQMLPVLGGVPMVWSGCVVFFQAVLLAGYGSAHVMTARIAAPVRLLVYAGLSVLPLVFSRLGVDASSAAEATRSPLSWLLVALLTSVGPSFLVLAVSASTLQATFASTRHPSARDPYFLYAASNAGSLTALIVYPTVVEPLLGLSRQADVWTLAYAVFVLLVLACAVVARFALKAPAAGDAAATGDAAAPAVETIMWRQRARWCLLAAVPSSLMLGVTTALTTDIAPVPLLWVAPLALYLVTFIVAFGGGRDRGVALANRLLPAMLLAAAVSLMLGMELQIGWALVVHLLPFLAAAMLCHGLLSKERPGARHLTEFYFWLALGGMAGGLFNTLAAPLLFSRIVEYPLALAAVLFLRVEDRNTARHPIDRWLPIGAVLLAGAILFAPAAAGRSPAMVAALATCAVLTLARRGRPFTLAAVASAFLLASPWVKATSETELHAERTFFGTYKVTLDRAAGTHALAHGTTLHGKQLVDATRRGEPLTYYHRTGPFGRLMASVASLREPGAAVAAVGLGVGTLGAYAEAGQRWTFYEIDPAIERIARDERYFSFLSACGDRCQVVLGDARLSLASQTGARYQLIAVDAFSSDAIPMHLLTREAMQVYLSRLAPRGVLAIHISNRHLRLDGVVGRLALSSGLVAVEWLDRRRSADWPAGKTPSRWVVMARSRDDLGALATDPAWTPPAVAPTVPLWTDDFSNILDVLEIRSR